MFKSLAQLVLALSFSLASAQAFAQPARWSMQLECSDGRDHQYQVHVAVESDGVYNTPSYHETYLAAYVTRTLEDNHQSTGYMNSQPEFSLKGDGYDYSFVSKAQKLKLKCVRPLDGGASGSN